MFGTELRVSKQNAAMPSKTHVRNHSLFPPHDKANVVSAQARCAQDSLCADAAASSCVLYHSLSSQTSSFHTPTSCRSWLSWATARTMASLTSCCSSRTARTSSCNQLMCQFMCQFMCRTCNKSSHMLQRRHPAPQYAAALTHAGDADKVGGVMLMSRFICQTNWNPSF